MIYNYNFIGNPKEQKCIGPMAQDWHSLITPLEPIVEEKEDSEDSGKTVLVERDAKDKLTIETMDAIGICLASIKGLTKKVNSLENENMMLRSELDNIKKHLKL